MQKGMIIYTIIDACFPILMLFILFLRKFNRGAVLGHISHIVVETKDTS